MWIYEQYNYPLKYSFEYWFLLIGSTDDILSDKYITFGNYNFCINTSALQNLPFEKFKISI